MKKSIKEPESTPNTALKQRELQLETPSFRDIVYWYNITFNSNIYIYTISVSYIYILLLLLRIILWESSNLKTSTSSLKFWSLPGISHLLTSLGAISTMGFQPHPMGFQPHPWGLWVSWGFPTVSWVPGVLWSQPKAVPSQDSGMHLGLPVSTSASCKLWGSGAQERNVNHLAPVRNPQWSLWCTRCRAFP